MSPIITVVGSFAVGLTIRTPQVPIFGQTLIGSDFDMGPGGKGSNQAVATARMGAHSYFVGLIGEDKLGEIAVDLYAAEGVDTQYLQKTSAMATGAGLIILNSKGENFIILDMGANNLMDAAFVDGANRWQQFLVVTLPGLRPDRRGRAPLLPRLLAEHPLSWRSLLCALRTAFRA